MMRSGWKKRKGVDRQYQLIIRKGILIILLTGVPLFVFPEVALTFGPQKTSFISRNKWNDSFFLSYSQKEKEILYEEDKVKKNKNCGQREQNIKQKFIKQLKNIPFGGNKRIVVTVKNEIINSKDALNNLTEFVVAAVHAFQGETKTDKNSLKARDSPFLTDNKKTRNLLIEMFEYHLRDQYHSLCT